MRARRLVAGDYQLVDLDRLFLGLRDRSGGRACFREVGDFVAHRDTREKGIVSQVGKDVFTSVDVWSLTMRGITPTFADVTRAAHANLRVATNEQLKARCGCNREAARSRLKNALTKIERGASLTASELQVLEYLGNTFIWRPAFSSEQLFREFTEVLIQNKMIGQLDRAKLAALEVFLTLYALALMHGSSITLENGHKAKLYAGYSNRDRLLEVKVEIVFNELVKPLMAPICLFLTNLKPDDHCEPNLKVSTDYVLYDHWKEPLEIDSSRRLKLMN
jgi:hypothetical protein